MFYVLYIFKTFSSVPGVSEQSSGFRVHLDYIIRFYIYMLYTVSNYLLVINC